jgi:hypothetical protein
MKFLLPLSLVLNFLNVCHSQDELQTKENFSNKNSVQFELFGHGEFYSVNYERILFNGHRFKTTAQLGAYYNPFASSNVLGFPLLINELLTFKSHHMEIGAGVVLSHQYAFDDYIQLWALIPNARVGYRYQPADGRFILRTAWTPHMGQYGDLKHYAGLSVGYSF